MLRSDKRVPASTDAGGLRLGPEERRLPAAGLEEKSAGCGWREGEAVSTVRFSAASGKLYVFKPREVQVLLAWPKPMAWRKSERAPQWQCFRPAIRILPDVERLIRIHKILRRKAAQPTPPSGFGRPCHFSEERLRWLRWYETIPADVRAVLSRFPDRQWHLLALVARCGNGALDLAVANPALAFALASNWVFHRPPVQRPLRSARALLRKSQRSIQEWLGFPSTECARRILRALDHRAIAIQALLYLREALKDEGAAKVLRHLSRINRDVLRIVSDARLFARATPRLLEEVALAQSPDHFEVARRIQDLVNMARFLGRPEASLPALRSISHLSRLHDELLEQLTHADDEQWLNLRFPAAPLAGNETIVPLTTPQALIEEGRVQHNCIAAFAYPVAVAENYYVYKVLSPQRCTLALLRSGAKWVVHEIAAACNQPASEEAEEAVRRWLSERRDPN